jgi:ferredoxin-NADP reductase
MSPSELPPDLYCRARTDRFIRGVTVVGEAYYRLLEHRSRRITHLKPKSRIPPAWLELLVANVERECDGVVSLRLTGRGNGTLPTWQPGCHLRIRLPSGRIRHYSLCGDPKDRHTYRIAVRRVDGGGGGSIEIHAEMRAGMAIHAMCPRNSFPFAAESKTFFIAGGIGITPILPMVREAAIGNQDWHLVYTGRTLDSMPFVNEVIDISAGRTQFLPDNSFGVPDCAQLVEQIPLDAAIYCCAPSAMLNGIRTAASHVRSFHFERFTAPPITGGAAFDLELMRTGTLLRVPPDRSALDVLLEHDPRVPYSCRQGFCGTCRQRVLQGAVEHRDQLLTDVERYDGDILVCVSRAPKGERLVLDL